MIIQIGLPVYQESRFSDRGSEITIHKCKSDFAVLIGSKVLIGFKVSISPEVCECSERCFSSVISGGTVREI